MTVRPFNLSLAVPHIVYKLLLILFIGQQEVHRPEENCLQQSQ